MNVGHLLLIGLAGLLAGGANAIAGGGTLISFPALLAIGMPPVAANITSHVGLISGYAGGAVGYRRELQQQGPRIRALCVAAMAGGITGAVVLLVTPDRSFRIIVPYLVLLSCALMAVQPHVGGWLAQRRRAAASVVTGTAPAVLGTATAGPRDRTGGVTPSVHGAVFVAGVYGSYFGAGLGVLLLAVLGILLDDDLQRLNGLKTVLSLAVNAVGVLVFLVVGRVGWQAAGILFVTAYLGGLLGARFARRLRPALLRGCVVVLGVAVAGTMIITS